MTMINNSFVTVACDYALHASHRIASHASAINPRVSEGGVFLHYYQRHDMTPS